MKPLVFHPIYSQLNLPVRHRFPIQKYQGIYDALLKKGVSSAAFSQPKAVTEQQLAEVFCPQYVRALCHGQLDEKAMRRIGFPWSSQLIQRSLTAVGGTCQTAHLAAEHGIALNLTGGYHHGFRDFGSGFCLFNDLYFAAQQMLKRIAVDRVMVIDCDVHQGDGTAKLAENDARIFTLSVHCERNFPHRKQQSDVDIGLEKGTTDAEYLETLEQALILAFRQCAPDFVIYDAGVDVHEDDDLGLLNVSTQGVYERDKLVLDWCQREGIPVACVIGGGYQRDIGALVNVHLQLFRAAGVVA
ncbi:histone deacetylase [Aestuariibacter sp. A3R04]|uniref:histone deacetylase family protein n=1 Tax=Aestuariibacter sp. A3R04 TaxID=2841571 RepID=UPI001C08A113|nr:histone deacetylase [Aestuariibacter sp. A3R04]